MKIIRNWNNQRRNKEYWFAIIIFAFIIFNPGLILNNQKLRKTYIAIDRSFRLYGKTNMNEVMAILSVISVCLVILLSVILLENAFIGWLLDRVFIVSVLIVTDGIIGGLLDIAAIKSCYLFVKLGGIFSLGSFIYEIFLILCSIMFWDSVLPIREYYRAARIIKQNTDFNEIWYCISNAECNMSVLYRPLWKSKCTNIIINEKDIKKKSNTKEIYLKKKCFSNYLIIIDAKERIDYEFKKEIVQTLKIPHAKIGMIILNDHKNNENIRNSAWQKNIKIRNMYNKLYMENILRMDRIIDEVKINSNNKMRLPFQFIESKFLMKIYFEWKNEKDIRLLFLKKILVELSAPQAIYALFDFIDLNYRFLIAYYNKPDYRMMKDIGAVIGRLNPMEGMIEKKLGSEWEQINQMEMEIKEIITNLEYEVIKKYMPTYEWKKKYGFVENINYLTRKLRNVLRGHGSFEVCDLNILYELVFKLAIWNMYILRANELDIYTYEKNIENCKYKNVYGKFRGKERNLSPFVIRNKENEILIFNNWNKKLKYPIEYINFLDGTIENYKVNIL